MTLKFGAAWVSAAAPQAFGGLKIYPQANWPRVQDGTRQVRFPAHPLICWLARWLPIKPYIEATYPRTATKTR